MTTEQELVNQGAIQLAMREEDITHGIDIPSKKRICSKCGHVVLISESAFPLADKLEVICSVCLYKGLPQ